MANYFRVEDLQVYQRLCELHLEVCQLSRSWPREERYELTSQVRRSSNSAAANLAEKHNDRHVRNQIEGVNRSRGESLETVHHLYIAHRKGYLSQVQYEELHKRYHECVRMLNGLERSLESKLERESRLWPDAPPADSRSPRQGLARYGTPVKFSEPVHPKALTPDH
jgi:four helix bundle protein